MDPAKPQNRRSFLTYTAYAMGAIAVSASGLVMIDSMNPAADVWARDITNVDLKNIKPGQRVVVAWRRMPIFIYHRTKEDIAEARSVDWRTLRDPQSDEERVLKGHENWLVVIGLCSLNGLVLFGNSEGQPRGEKGGWKCWHCLSAFDKSGRVYYGPVSKNLGIPAYSFMEDGSLRIGGKPITTPVGR